MLHTLMTLTVQQDQHIKYLYFPCKLHSLPLNTSAKKNLQFGTPLSFLYNLSFNMRKYWMSAYRQMLIIYMEIRNKPNMDS